MSDTITPVEDTNVQTETADSTKVEVEKAQNMLDRIQTMADSAKDAAVDAAKEEIGLFSDKFIELADNAMLTSNRSLSKSSDGFASKKKQIEDMALLNTIVDSIKSSKSEQDFNFDSHLNENLNSLAKKYEVSNDAGVLTYGGEVGEPGNVQALTCCEFYEGIIEFTCKYSAVAGLLDQVKMKTGEMKFRWMTDSVVVYETEFCDEKQVGDPLTFGTQQAELKKLSVIMPWCQEATRFICVGDLLRMIQEAVGRGFARTYDAIALLGDGSGDPVMVNGGTAYATLTGVYGLLHQTEANGFDGTGGYPNGGVNFLEVENSCGITDRHWAYLALSTRCCPCKCDNPTILMNCDMLTQEIIKQKGPNNSVNPQFAIHPMASAPSGYGVMGVPISLTYAAASPFQWQADPEYAGLPWAYAGCFKKYKMLTHDSQNGIETDINNVATINIGGVQHNMWQKNWAAFLAEQYVGFHNTDPSCFTVLKNVGDFVVPTP